MNLKGSFRCLEFYGVGFSVAFLYLPVFILACKLHWWWLVDKMLPLLFAAFVNQNEYLSNLKKEELKV